MYAHILGNFLGGGGGSNFIYGIKQLCENAIWASKFVGIKINTSIRSYTSTSLQSSSEGQISCRTW